MKKTLAILIVLIMILALMPMAFAGDTVTFISNGETYTTVEATDAGKIEKPADPLGTTGSTFAGWYTDSNCTTPFDFDNDTTEKLNDNKLYAKWTAATYSVTLETNGGAITEGKNITSYTYGVGANLPTNSDVNKDESTFNGWYVSSTFTGDPVTQISVSDTGRKTFCAKWTCNVVLQANGGTIADGKNVNSYVYGIGATLPTKADMSKVGYEFGGWYTSGMFTGDPVTQISTTDTGTKTFYAKWIPTYTVTLNADGGTIAAGKDVTFYIEGVGATLPTKDDVTKTGYTFAGWYDSAGNKVDAITTSDSGDKTYTAHWTANTYTIAWENNGGSISSEKQPTQYTYGTTVTLPTKSDISRSGCTFAGWYTSSTFSGSPVTTISATTSGNQTFYAKWTCTVTFYPNGGSAVDTKTVTAGTAVTKPADPTYVGYSLVGWYTDTGLTNAYDFRTAVNANMCLYAKWTTSSWTLTLGKFYGGTLGRAYYSRTANGYDWKEVTSTTGQTISASNNEVIYFKMDPYSGYYRHPYIVNANGSYYAPYIANGIFAVTVTENKTIKLNFSKSVPTGDASMWQYVVAALASSGTATGVVAYAKSKTKKK